MDFAEKKGYKHIYLAGHSLGANKVIYYLSRNHDPRVEKYILLSPANITHLLNGVSDAEKNLIKVYKKKEKIMKRFLSNYLAGSNVLPELLMTGCLIIY